MNTSVKNELEKYITELEFTMDLMRNSDFPFSDAVLIYEEVLEHLQSIASVE